MNDRRQMDDAFHAVHLLTQALEVIDVAGAVFRPVDGQACSPPDDPHPMPVSDQPCDGGTAHASRSTGHEDIHWAFLSASAQRTAFPAESVKPRADRVLGLKADQRPCAVDADQRLCPSKHVLADCHLGKEYAD